MAKLIRKEAQIFSDRMLRQIEAASIDYAVFFEGAPLFVTYYSKNVLNSGAVTSLDAPVGLLGIDSPIKYNKIENLPIYNLSGISDISQEIGDFGLDSEVSGEGIIIPSTIEPLEEDFFYIPQISDKYLFKVDKVEHDKISGKQFWKINFHIIQEEVELLDEQVTEFFELDYDRLSSTEYKPIISKGDAALVRMLDETYDLVVDFITENFYYDNLNYLRIEINGESIYDPIGSKFLVDQSLLIKPNIKDYLDFIYLSKIEFDQLTTQLYINELFKGTIYYALVNKSTDYLDTNRFSFIPVNNINKMNELNFEGRDIKIANYLLGSKYQVIDVNFKENCINNILYEDDITNNFENFLIKFMNNKLNKTNIVSELEKIEFEYDLRTFVFVPSLLYIIREIKRSLIIK